MSGKPVAVSIAVIVNISAGAHGTGAGAGAENVVAAWVPVTVAVAAE